MATVHPAAVEANRVLLESLVVTNLLGQNTPAIAATEFEYVEMWAQDVAAMLGYDAGAASVAGALPSFSAPPTSLTGLVSGIGAQVGDMAVAAEAAVGGLVAALPGVVAGAQSAAAASPMRLSSPLRTSTCSRIFSNGVRAKRGFQSVPVPSGVHDSLLGNGSRGCPSESAMLYP